VDIPKLGGSRAGDHYDDECPDLCGATVILVDGVCRECGPGEVNEGNMCAATDCAAGFCVTPGEECQICTPVTFELGGMCQPCAEGTFSFDEGVTLCIRYDADTVSGPGAESCTAREDGSIEVDNVACDVCPRGTSYSIEVSECIPCFAGLYQPFTGDSDCPDCPAGSGQPLEGQTSCI
jgi:hypothetical protein